MRTKKAITDPLLIAAIEDYSARYTSGQDQDIKFLQKIWGEWISKASDIQGAEHNEPLACIDVHFKNQDHVAVYDIVGNTVKFRGFES
jgi:hypothetical protein